jgi:hypothetical protein
VSELTLTEHKKQLQYVLEVLGLGLGLGLGFWFWLLLLLVAIATATATAREGEGCPCPLHDNNELYLYHGRRGNMTVHIHTFAPA